MDGLHWSMEIYAQSEKGERVIVVNTTISLTV